MARLRYTALTSLDLYVNDADGGFSWAEPTEELHDVVNTLEREVGTHLYGRRLYETMRAWETVPGDVPGPMGEYARIWRAADKVVYSSSLEVSTPRTRVERVFDPAAVRAMKAAASRDLSIGGAALAAEAIRAGLVDRYALVLVPRMVGGGTRALPDGVQIDLTPTAERRFTNGAVLLEYRPRR